MLHSMLRERFQMQEQRQARVCVVLTHHCLQPTTIQGEHVLVMAFAVAGNVLPITREQDYEAKKGCRHYGQPLRELYDVHYAQLDPEADTA